VVDLPSRILQSPKVGLGVTTAALIALTTTGTTLLLSHGTRDLRQPSPVVAAPQPSLVPRAPVVVDRAPGSITVPGPRTVVVRPVAPQPVVVVPDVPAPPVEGPVITPPVVTPPVVTPPVVEPPVVPPPVVDPDVKPGHGHRAHPAHPDDHGKHLGQLKH
jgi:hypothetical protein